LSSHCRTNSRRATSGGFKEDASVLLGRVSDPSDDVLGFFEALAGHHDDIDRVLDVAQRPPDPDASVARIGWFRFHHQQVDVAVLGHLARGGGSKQDDPVRPRHREDASNNLIQQCFIDTHSVPSYAKPPGVALGPRANRSEAKKRDIRTQTR
jgi:hypothetical protein